MNKNPEGTPNPLNPAPSTSEDMAAGTGPLEFVETANVSEIMEDLEPEKALEPTPELEVAPRSEDTPDTKKAAEPVKPASFTEPASGVVPPRQASRPNRSVMDPMMRPTPRNNFDTLAPNNNPPEEPLVEDFAMIESVSETPVTTPISDTPELVAKDSIVEPAGGNGKKKALIIGAIVLLIVGIICGAAAIAIAVLGNTGDRVSKAIEKLLNGEVSSIISAQGEITAAPNVDDSGIGGFNLDFNGTFDTKSGMNTISAEVETKLVGSADASIEIDEMRDQDGEVFFKVSGLDSLLEGAKTINTEDLINVTDCIDAANTTNCVSVTGTTTAADLISAYSGLVDVIDDQWILISDNFGDTMKSLGIFDNSSTCLINAVSTLPQYSKDIVKKYKENQFITYSTDKLEISKKKNPLYRLNFDANKLSAFVNSLSNNGFINELNACAGNIATNTNVTADMISGIFATFPTVYVEIDDNYNLTRVYFKAITNDTEASYETVEDCECVTSPCDCGSEISGEFTSMTVTADLNLTYPPKLEITMPSDYIEMSNLVNKLMTGVFTTNASN